MPKTASDDERYIKDTPKYFHDWFRLLGMLTTSGNLHPYNSMTPTANMKVYMAVDKTYAYPGDLITYTISYRNYASVNANNVSITVTFNNSDYQFVSASNGGTVSGNTITWNIGTVPGFQTATGIAPTTGTRTFTVRVRPTPISPRVCLTSTITSSNGPSWTSNEYPNNATYTMERNCVDLLTERALDIIKSVDKPVMNPGDVINFKLEFENKTGSNLWLNGGRDRVVISYGNYLLAPNTFYQFYRFWHSAQEAYVNMHNYRVSYYMNDAAAVGLYNAVTNPTGWAFSVDNQNDLDKYFYNPATLPANERITFSFQQIPWGSDANGSWNQRIMIRFANVITAPTTHIYDKLDNMYLYIREYSGRHLYAPKWNLLPPQALPPDLQMIGPTPTL
jgi:conserved repeat domain